MLRERFTCGPLEVRVEAASAALRDSIAATLEQHGSAWPRQAGAITLVVAATASRPEGHLRGDFLECGRMRVDATPGGLLARCHSGSSAAFDEEQARWSIALARPDGPEIGSDIEDLVLLALTTGWRRLGWVPLHAAAAADGERCVLVCAPSGGGKTSCAAALLHRGWSTLGDDKLLLRQAEAGCAEVAALVGHMNLHPRTREWFPEVGDLERVPTHSVWSEKRRVAIDAIWPGRMAARALPTHLIELRRTEQLGVRTAPMDHGETLAALLRQTVVPTHAPTARRILAVVSATARHVAGLRVEVGPDAYGAPECAATLERALG